MKNEEETKPRSLYNPTLDDITVEFDKLGENPETYTLKAGDYAEFPHYIADILEEKLVEKMLWENPPSNKNYNKRREELRGIIRV